jgi:hypothetical protein
MPNPSPPRLSATAHRARRNRVAGLASQLGFVGRVEYRHVYSRTGGASYGQAANEDQDLLTVYAEAFEREADPNEFSLNAILAHERGHQLFVRHPRLASRLAGLSAVSEEVLASILGGIICNDEQDRDDLWSKAGAELLRRGIDRETALGMVRQLTSILEALL